MRMKLKILATVTLSALSVLSFAATTDIEGRWRNIDDKTGFSKGIVEITKDANGIYSGKIVQVIPRPGYVPIDICKKCSGSLKNQPVVGLKVIDNMHQSAKDAHIYEGGTVTDPNNGKTYRAKMTVNEDGRRMILRGFVGFEKLGRNQVWFRE